MTFVRIGACPRHVVDRRRALADDAPARGHRSRGARAPG